MMTLSISTALVGCLRGRETNTVQYARSTQLPDELKGLMRLAQSEVKVNIIGSDKMGDFKTVEAASYILIHELDMAKFVRNTKRLQMLVEHLQKNHPGALKDAPNLPARVDAGAVTTFLDKKEE